MTLSSGSPTSLRLGSVASSRTSCSHWELDAGSETGKDAPIDLLDSMNSVCEESYPQQWFHQNLCQIGGSRQESCNMYLQVQVSGLPKLESSSAAIWLVCQMKFCWVQLNSKTGLFKAHHVCLFVVVDKVTVWHISQFLAIAVLAALRRYNLVSDEIW